MALWFVSYATSPITVTIYDVSNVIVYDVALLLSMTYHFQSRLGKTDCTDIWVIKLKNQVSPSIGFWVPHWNPMNGVCQRYRDYRRVKHYPKRSVRDTLRVCCFNTTIQRHVFYRNGYYHCNFVQGRVLKNIDFYNIAKTNFYMLFCDTVSGWPSG